MLVRNLPPGVDDEDLRTLLSRHGELRDLGAQQRARGGRGSVLATFYDLRHARDAVRAIDGTVHFGRRLDARFQCPTTTTATDIILPPSASSPPTNSAAAGVGNNNNVSTTTTAANHGTLVVFNLDASTAADDVRALFSSIGDVKEIRATPNKKHHKFVEFYDIRDAERALHALNKTEVAGKRIKIEISRPGGRAAGAARAAAAAALAAQQQAMGNGESPSAKMASSSARTPGGQVHNAWSSSRRGGGGGGGGGPSSSPLAVPKARAALSMDDELDILASSFPPLRLSGTNAEAQSLDRGSTVLSGRGGGGGGGDGRPSSNVDHHHHLVHQQQQHCINNNNVRNNARLLSLGLSCANNSSNVLDLVDLAAAGELSSSAALSGSRLSPRESYREVLNHSPRSDGAASSGSPGTADGSASSPLSTTASAFGGGQAPRSFDEGAGGMLHGENNDLAIVRPAALHAGVLANGATSNGHALACVQQQAVGNGTGGNGGGQQQQGHHQSHVGSTSTNHAKFALDLERVRSGEETRTALMIRNIPNKYNQKMLVSTLEERHKGHFDFIYLPIDFKNKCNVGYAFINMTKPTFIDSFYQAFHGKKWGRFNSEKVCEITFARIQGRQQLIAHFQNSSLLLEDPKCRPVIFDAFGRQEEFPIGLHVRTRRGPCSRDSAAVAAAAAAATAAGACTTNTTSPSPGACVNGNAGTTAAAAGTAMMTNTCSTCTTSTSDNNSATATTTNTTAAMKTAGTRPANGCVTSQNMVVGSPCTTPTCTPTSSQLTGLTCGVSAAAVAAAGACVTTATTRTTTAPSSSADSLSGASGSCGGGDGSSRL